MFTVKNDKKILYFLYGIIILLSLSLLGVLTLCAKRQEVSGPRLAMEPTGKRIVEEGIAFRVNGIRTDDVGAGPLVPRKGDHFVVADVTIENLATTTLQVAPLLSFHIKDDRGLVYSTVSVPSAKEMLSGDMLPGDILREEIGFSVDKTAKNLRLYYEPGRFGEEVMVVSLSQGGLFSPF